MHSGRKYLRPTGNIIVLNMGSLNSLLSVLFNVFWLKTLWFYVYKSNKTIISLPGHLALYNANKWQIGPVGLLFAMSGEVNIIDKNNASFPLKDLNVIIR
jgi:hypothetical protein